MSAMFGNVVVPRYTADEREHFAVVCKTLSHPARVQIVQFLAGVDTCFCEDIVRQLPLAQPTVS